MLANHDLILDRVADRVVEPWKLALPRSTHLPEREFFIDNLLVRIHFIIVIIRWTGLAPWEFEFPFPGSQPRGRTLEACPPPPHAPVCEREVEKERERVCV